MIYCDHNATTPLRPEVLAAMLPFMEGDAGNASSVHRFGNRARCAIETAREQVAQLLGVAAAEILFTGGGTESNNLALYGARPSNGRPAVVTSAIEHASVREVLADLGERGRCVRVVAVDALGRMDPVDFAAQLQPDVGLASVGWANNEIGTVQPMAAIAALCRERGILLHSDAVQAAGKLALSAAAVDLLSLSAHKLGGPQGVGALYVRREVQLTPLLRGGHQERGRRAGTENVAGIVGFGAACRLAASELTARCRRMSDLRDRLWSRLSAIPGAHRHGGCDGEALPNTLNLRFDAVRGEALVAALDLDAIAVSSGSACAAGSGEPSHVLQALGVDEDGCRDGVRFSLGVQNTEAEIATVADAVETIVSRMRAAQMPRRAAGGR